MEIYVEVYNMCIKFSAKNLIVLFSVFVCMLMCNSAVFAMDFSQVTTDSKITKALKALERVHSFDVLNKVMYDNTSRRPVKIMFYSLATLSPKYAEAHALATGLDDGTAYILIDSRHRNASPEEIACLIAHEITHQLAVTTMEEEIRAWTNEAQQWIKFKSENPDLKTSGELTNRLNRLVAMYNDSTIAYDVRTNRHYAGLK